MFLAFFFSNNNYLDSLEVEQEHEDKLVHVFPALHYNQQNPLGAGFHEAAFYQHQCNEL